MALSDILPELDDHRLNRVRGSAGRKVFTRFGAKFGGMSLAILLSACASLNPNYEQPTVTLSSFKAIPSEGMVPAFEVGLRIINPNRETLNLNGIVYTISLQGHEVVKGVGRDFPAIEGYSEGVVRLTASANLLAGIRFIGDMMGRPEDTLNYEFEAKLDIGGLLPPVRIRESGEFDLRGN